MFDINICTSSVNTYFSARGNWRLLGNREKSGFNPGNPGISNTKKPVSLIIKDSISPQTSEKTTFMSL